MLRRYSIAVLTAGAIIAGSAAKAQTPTQTNTTGSAGCAAITQAAATGAANRIAADAQTIQQPASVTSLTCLNNIFGATGLNLVTNLLNPQTLLNSDREPDLPGGEAGVEPGYRWRDVRS